MLTKALGCTSFVEPDVSVKGFLKDDILILTSDGLTNMVSDQEIYIAKREECPELFSYFMNEINGEFVEQAGSGYLFTDGVSNYVISSEVYWGKFKVWTLPKIEK